jgi:hypothetical protein
MEVIGSSISLLTEAVDIAVLIAFLMSSASKVAIPDPLAAAISKAPEADVLKRLVEPSISSVANLVEMTELLVALDAAITAETIISLFSDP